MTNCHQGRRILGAGRFIAFGVCVVTGAVGCGAGSPQQSEHASKSRVDLQAFQGRFTVVDSLVLEEPENVVTINPLMFMDPRGGFLIVENGEEQVRVYSRTGELKDVFGEGTGKADSLRAPTGAGRLANGDIIATSLLSRRLTIIPAQQQKPVRFIETPIRLLEGVQVLNERQVLLTGPDAPYAKTLLHIWDLSRGEIVKSFFPPPKQLDSNVVLILGRVHTASRGDRIAALHSLSDTLFFCDRAGTVLFSVHIPVEPFSVPKGPLPRINSMEKRREWIDQWTLLSDVFWIDDDELIVQWVMGSRRHAVYGLVQMDTTGRQIWTMARTPRLLGVRDDRFLFQDPNSDAPNRLIVAARKGAFLN